MLDLHEALDAWLKTIEKHGLPSSRTANNQLWEELGLGDVESRNKARDLLAQHPISQSADGASITRGMMLGIIMTRWPSIQMDLYKGWVNGEEIAALHRELAAKKNSGLAEIVKRSQTRLLQADEHAETDRIRKEFALLGRESEYTRWTLDDRPPPPRVPKYPTEDPQYAVGDYVEVSLLTGEPKGRGFVVDEVIGSSYIPVRLDGETRKDRKRTNGWGTSRLTLIRKAGEEEKREDDEHRENLEYDDLHRELYEQDKEIRDLRRSLDVHKEKAEQLAAQVKEKQNEFQRMEEAWREKIEAKDREINALQAQIVAMKAQRRQNGVPENGERVLKYPADQPQFAVGDRVRIAHINRDGVVVDEPMGARWVPIRIDGEMRTDRQRTDGWLAANVELIEEIGPPPKGRVPRFPTSNPKFAKGDVVKIIEPLRNHHGKRGIVVDERTIDDSVFVAVRIEGEERTDRLRTNAWTAPKLELVEFAEQEDNKNSIVKTLLSELERKPLVKSCVPKDEIITFPPTMPSGPLTRLHWERTGGMLDPEVVNVRYAVPDWVHSSRINEIAHPALQRISVERCTDSGRELWVAVSPLAQLPAVEGMMQEILSRK